MCVLVASSVVFHKVIVFTNAAFKDREVTYMASNNINSVGKSIGVKVSPILFVKVSVSVLVSAILSAHSIGIVIGRAVERLIFLIALIARLIILIAR